MRSGYHLNVGHTEWIRNLASNYMIFIWYFFISSHSLRPNNSLHYLWFKNKHFQLLLEWYLRISYCKNRLIYPGNSILMLCIISTLNVIWIWSDTLRTNKINYQYNHPIQGSCADQGTSFEIHGLILTEAWVVTPKLCYLKWNKLFNEWRHLHYMCSKMH